jgi:hypothetical protein
VLGGNGNREERIMRGLGRQQPVVADVLELLRAPSDLDERPTRHPRIDLHVASSLLGRAGLPGPLLLADCATSLAGSVTALSSLSKISSRLRNGRKQDG